MVSKKIKLQRESINSVLAQIVDVSKQVDVILQNEIHPRGILYRVLDSNREGYILHSNKNGGFRAKYIGKDGVAYSIDILSSNNSR